MKNIDMEMIHNLKASAAKELYRLVQKREKSPSEWEFANILTEIIKNAGKICMMEEGGGYSQAGDWEAMLRGNYGHGNSYANRGQHLVRAHYSRDGGDYSQAGDYSRNGDYSRGGGYSQGGGHDMEYLERMMREATTEQQRDAARRLMDAMRNG